jgi:hypothetical protein
MAKCGYISHGKCPGGSDIKCHDLTGYCMHVADSRCPGHHATNFKYLVKMYKKPGTDQGVQC